MSQQKYPKAYEAYQQAVYRDGRNPTFWCSIGVLYYQINQYRDALDAYSRAIRLNPYISEVWYDLGTLVSSMSPCTLISFGTLLTTPAV
jgi:glucose repression mediator protein